MHKNSGKTALLRLTAGTTALIFCNAPPGSYEFCTRLCGESISFDGVL